MGVVALCAAVASLGLGVRDVPLGEVVDALLNFDASNADHMVVRELRVARAVAALIGGAALGVAGALMQTMTRNPLADPGILGINSGAAFGVAVGIWALQLTAPGALVIPALAGATVSAVLVLLLGGGMRRDGPDPIRMVLVGAGLSALFLSLTWGLLILSRQSLDIYRYWVLGGFNQIDPQSLWAVSPLFVLGFIAAAIASFLLNPLAVGDDTARALGVRVGLTRLVSLIAVVLLCGTTVSVAGPIAFVGLVVPHLVRPFVHGDTRRLAFGSAVLGAALAMIADVAGRFILPGQEVEAGAVMALIGGAALVLLVQRRREVRL
ncbi:iron ABC transporter permease [Tateyamaria sp. syn59]|uniref:FecCD family ABC transporter permease n=1 Tax=Tateyamaria sp. syn59 TaxID=2576942 RepID=UPI001CB948F3|nr:iron ABC transporter permease [Tateyamaria sp. syn59]